MIETFRILNTTEESHLDATIELDIDSATKNGTANFIRNSHGDNKMVPLTHIPNEPNTWIYNRGIETWILSRLTIDDIRNARQSRIKPTNLIPPLHIDLLNNVDISPDTELEHVLLYYIIGDPIPTITVPPGDGSGTGGRP